MFRKNRAKYGASETLDAGDSLKKILDVRQPILAARSPFGVFKLIGLNVGLGRKLDIPIEWLQSVCFSETPLRELKSFYQSTQSPQNYEVKTNKYKNFGLAFPADFLRSRGGHPVFYYDRRNGPLRNAIESLGENSLQPITRAMLPLCEPYGPQVPNETKEIDFRWEREWRLVGDLKFEWKDVAFGICPAQEIEKYEDIVNKTFPFVDPSWDMDRLKKDLEERKWAKLASQI